MKPTKEQKNEINNIKKKFSDYREINKLNKQPNVSVRETLNGSGFNKITQFHILRNSAKIAELEMIIEVLINE